jgi:TonB-dependent starch-binding outer membrane protein SusC
MNMASIFRHARDVTVVLLTAALAAGCASTPDGEPAGAADPDDRVSIGYGTQDRSEVTGAVASVTAGDVAGQPVNSLEDLIRGRFPGVQVERLPNGGISLRIRGTNSLMGSGEPLYVINGMPIQSSPGTALMALSPNDIERIDILRDAGATAIYGSRGANGVVLITTKQAR